jgi:hypothetical protein
MDDIDDLDTTSWSGFALPVDHGDGVASEPVPKKQRLSNVQRDVLIQNLINAGVFNVTDDPTTVILGTTFYKVNEKGTCVVHWKQIADALGPIDTTIAGNKRKRMAQYQSVIRASLPSPDVNPPLSHQQFSELLALAREAVSEVRAMRTSLQDLVQLSQSRPVDATAPKRKRDEPVPPPSIPRAPTITDTLVESLLAYAKSNDAGARQKAVGIIKTELASHLTLSPPPAVLRPSGWSQTVVIDIPMAFVAQKNQHTQLLPFLHRTARDVDNLLKSQAFPLASFDIDLKQVVPKKTSETVSFSCVFNRV